MIVRLVVVRRVVVVLRALVRVRPRRVVVVLLAVAVVHGAGVAVVEVRVPVLRFFRLELRLRGLRFFERRHGRLLGDGYALWMVAVGSSARQRVMASRGNARALS